MLLRLLCLLGCFIVIQRTLSLVDVASSVALLFGEGDRHWPNISALHASYLLGESA